jgi:hypothetical protein
VVVKPLAGWPVLGVAIRSAERGQKLNRNRFVSSLALFLAVSGCSFISAGYLWPQAGGTGKPSTRQLFVSAGAPAGGNGSQQAPFNSLAAVEEASSLGDEIVVLPSPLSVPPLDGGIALKAHQKLIGHGPSVKDVATFTQAPRITNSTGASNSGDAVVLADYTEVSNLVIVHSYRGGIYGSDVTGVNIHDNNLAGTNTSCTPGYFVYFPAKVPLLANGWAAIMIDEDKGTSSVFIQSNYIHDGTCNDGIDIRATREAEVTVRIDSNNITHLGQGPKFTSLEGIGLQTRDAAVLTVESDHNSETYLGSPNANADALFTNQTGGVLNWDISYNTFAHATGGRSCNGGEFYSVNGFSTTNVYISHSTFEDDPGDMLEEINAGTGSTMNLTLEDVTIRHTTIQTPLPPEPKFSSGFGGDVNLSRCVAQASLGHDNVSNFRMIDSRFFDCAGDGVGSIVAGASLTLPRRLIPGAPRTTNFGDAVGDSMSIDIQNSTIAGVHQDVLHFTNQAAMNELAIWAENNLFSDAQGPAIVAFDKKGSTDHADIDLGGGKDHSSAGENCIVGPAHLAAEATGYNVSAKSNWWGRPEGPLPAEISVTDGNVNFVPPLYLRPPACKETK